MRRRIGKLLDRVTTRGRTFMRAHRRGVASVLAMMFLIIFGSLVAAMSVASTGNIRTAHMHIQVMKAMGAAETGMAIAEERLAEAASRFVVSRSRIDSDLAFALWSGTGDTGTIEVLEPPSGHAEGSLPSSIAQALVNRHTQETNLVVGVGGPNYAEVAAAPAGTDTSVYQPTHWVYTPAIALEPQPADSDEIPPAFQIRYAPLAGTTRIRVLVDGIVFDYRSNRAIHRTISRDFELAKRVEHAIVSHSRVLIGKNVQIEGDVGARFDDIDMSQGDSIVMRSDFYGLDPVLDLKLDDFFARINTPGVDIDFDDRLRLNHPVEGAGVPADEDFDGDGAPDGAYQDVNGDGYLDEMDIFIRHFDENGDGRVALSNALMAGTPAGDASATPEFVDSSGNPIDDDLALLIDSAMPDRNRNGVYGHIDIDGDGVYDPTTEEPADFDPTLSVYADQELGWRDGYIDDLDLYAKIHGKLMFRVTSSDWEAEQGDFRDKLSGAIRPDVREEALKFGADDDELPNITVDSFNAAETTLVGLADGDPFWNQVAAQLGVGVGDLDGWMLADNPGGAGVPHYTAVHPDANYDGVPDNALEAYYETSPFNSPSYADVYYRPRFRNMVFRNVTIPMGLNALFESCTFVGVTHVEVYESNIHVNWTLYGARTLNGAGNPELVRPRYAYGDIPAEDGLDAPPMLPSSAVPPNDVLMMINWPSNTTLSPLDKGDILASQIGAFPSAQYNALPDPLVINGRRVHDTKPFSNNLRFHDCLFVGSVVTDKPTVYTQVRNKLQFTGATRFALEHPVEPLNGYLNPDPDDLDDIMTSSLMAPNFSVDIGSFNSPPEQDVRLTGAVVAGVLDVRGNTEIVGTMLLTFDPQRGVAPMIDVFGAPVGNPAHYNASLGYFGADEGDYESEDPTSLPIVGGVRIVGWDTDGDGIADVDHSEPQPPGSTPVPFNGFGKVRVRYDPSIGLPDGLMLPLSAPRVPGTYSEGGV